MKYKHINIGLCDVTLVQFKEKKHRKNYYSTYLERDIFYV